MLISKAVRMFIRYCKNERHLSKNTIDAYQQDLSELISFLGCTSSVKDHSGTDILRYRKYLIHERRLALATVKRRITCARALFKWLVKRQGLQRTPFHDLEIQVRLPDRLPRTLSADDAARLAAHRRAHGPQVAIIVSLLLVTGMRVGELVRLTVDDVDVTSGRIRVFGKGARERIVFLPNEILREDLRRYLFGRPKRNRRREQRLLTTERGRCFTTARVRKCLSSLAESAGLPGHVTPHMLRHTAATLLLEAGTDIRFVQRLLGHRSIATTQIYAHVSDRALQNELARADILSRLASDIARCSES